eukprot:10261676-Karenia_brevis.AAC.1
MLHHTIHLVVSQARVLQAGWALSRATVTEARDGARLAPNCLAELAELLLDPARRGPPRPEPGPNEGPG